MLFLRPFSIYVTVDIYYLLEKVTIAFEKVTGIFKALQVP